MLQNIHEKIKGWVAAVLLGFISLTFALWGISNYFNSGGAKVVVAKVNGTKITEDQLDQAFKQYQQQQEVAGANTPEADKALKQSILRAMILKQVLVQGAIAAHYDVTPQYLDAVIMQLPFFQENGQFSKNRFFQVLNRLGVTEQQYLQQLRDQLLLNQLQMSFMQTAFALPIDIAKTIQWSHQQREISYALIQPNAVIADSLVTPEQVKAYYEHHGQDFQIPEQVQLAYIKLSMEDLAKKIKPAEESLKRYYEDNKDMFITNGHQQTYEAAKPAVMQAVIKQQAEQRFASDSEKLANLAYEDPTSLESTAKALDLSVQLTPFIGKVGGSDPLTTNKALLTQVFSEEVYGQGYNSKVISLSDTEQVVVRIASKKASAIKPLAQVQENIQNILRKTQLQQQLQSLASQAVAALLQGKSMVEVAKQYHLQWQASQVVQRTSSLPSAILAAAFNLESNKPAKDVALAEGSYAVVVLQKVLPGSTANVTDAEKKTLAQQVAENYGKNAFDAYSESLLHKAKIKNELAS